MFDAITKMRSIKRETNEDSINNHIFKKTATFVSDNKLFWKTVKPLYSNKAKYKT